MRLPIDLENIRTVENLDDINKQGLASFDTSTVLKICEQTHRADPCAMSHLSETAP